MLICWWVSQFWNDLSCLYCDVEQQNYYLKEAPPSGNLHQCLLTEGIPSRKKKRLLLLALFCINRTTNECYDFIRMSLQYRAVQLYNNFTNSIKPIVWWKEDSEEVGSHTSITLEPNALGLLEICTTSKESRLQDNM